ncbi:hypothetical protein QJQ45_024058 [Haematococcus lacustris]|nr:hypothetical protein QJQ45_024058 [Haematococcus lacustris]
MTDSSADAELVVAPLLSRVTTVAVQCADGKVCCSRDLLRLASPVFQDKDGSFKASGGGSAESPKRLAPSLLGKWLVLADKYQLQELRESALEYWGKLSKTDVSDALGNDSQLLKDMGQMASSTVARALHLRSRSSAPTERSAAHATSFAWHRQCSRTRMAALRRAAVVVQKALSAWHPVYSVRRTQAPKTTCRQWQLTFGQLYPISPRPSLTADEWLEVLPDADEPLLHPHTSTFMLSLPIVQFNMRSVCDQASVGLTKLMALQWSLKVADSGYIGKWLVLADKYQLQELRESALEH